MSGEASPKLPAGLKVWHKLLFISLSFLVPIAVMFWLLVQGINERIEFARLEQAGNEYQAALEVLLDLVPQHQLAGQRLQAGLTNGHGDLAELVPRIDQAFAGLEAVDARLGGRLQFTQERLAKQKREHACAAALQQEWQALKSDRPGRTPAAWAERHLHLIAGVRTMITHAGDTSNLILDPDLDSYYLMDVTLLALPQTQDRLAFIMAQGEAALRAKALSPAARTQLIIHAALFREADLERISSGARTALTEDENFYGTQPALQTNLPPALEAFAAATGAFLRLLSEVAEAERTAVTAEEFLAVGARARAASFRFWHTTRGELDGLLQARIQHYTRARIRAVTVTAFALAASVVFVFFVTRSISGPLRRQAEALAGANEGLRTEIIERKKADEERARLVDFLEASLNEVYVFDPASLRFSYVNRSARQNLGYTAEQIAQLTPLDLKPKFTEETFRQAIEPLLAGTVPKHLFQTLHRRADGTDYPVEVCLQLVATGTERVFLAVINDITERKRAEAELTKTQKELLTSSHLAGMAEIATGVLHNVGNVLNSVNVSANYVSDQVRKTPVADLSRVVALLREQGANLGAFFASDPRGPKVPEFLANLADKFTRQQEKQLQEIASLQKNIEHIKDIVAMQQSYAKVSGLTENLSPVELIDDAEHVHIGSFLRHEIELVRELAPDLPSVCVDKHKVLQILVNLLRNAKHACEDAGRPDKRIIVRATDESERVHITIIDNGVGIPPENLTCIFNHGFTTKKDGHGFGLHSAAIAAKDLGGALTVHSDGLGKGATFTLELPTAAQTRLGALRLARPTTT